MRAHCSQSNFVSSGVDLFMQIQTLGKDILCLHNTLFTTHVGTQLPEDLHNSLQSELMSSVPCGWRDKASCGVIKREASVPCGWRDKTLKGVIIQPDPYGSMLSWLAQNIV